MSHGIPADEVQPTPPAPPSYAMRARLQVTDVQTVTDSLTGDAVQDHVTFCAVYSPDPASENAQWSKWTPSADLRITINNPRLVGRFKRGQEFFVDFTRADAHQKADDPPAQQ